MGTCKIPDAILQTGRVVNTLSALRMIAGFHPAGEDQTSGTDALWVPAHGSLWLAFTIALLEWMGVYIVQASQVRRPDVIACALLAGVGQLWPGYELLLILRQPTPLAQAK